MLFFTSDEHYNHPNIIKYCKRPFSSVEEMNESLVENHNRRVGTSDTTYHLGDFSFGDMPFTSQIINRLNGKHVFLRGDHDRWIKYFYHEATVPDKELKCRIEHNSIIKINVFSTKLFCCHYPLRRWPRSHYNTWHIFGHTHGNLSPEGKSWDVGVDNNSFSPISLQKLQMIMNTRPNNVNFINPN